MKILSVDDNAENLYLIEMTARAHGHEVGSARNGLEALEQLAARSFDLIVSDILMPGMDGFQLCRTVKSDDRFKRIPFIFYTATYTSRQDEELGLALGASRFIVKPIDPEEFLVLVEQAVGERETGALPVPVVDLENDRENLSFYNERLVRKLERKVQQLEAARTELTASNQDKELEILQRRLAEAALTHSEAQLRLMWEKSMDGMRLIGRDGTILRVNPAFARMFAKAPESLPGQPFTSCYRSEDRERIMARYRERVESGTVERRIECVLHRWDGEAIWVEGSNTPIEQPSGPVVFTILRDVTQRKGAEQERASLEAQLRQAQKLESIGRLAGGIAHDFNNLLTVINGYSGLLLGKLSATDPMRKSVGEIRKAGERAAALTQQLLTFSRRQSVEAKPLNLGELLTSAESMIQRLVGADMEVTVGADGSPAWVMADAGQVQQVLLNLVVNARDAMPQGGKLTIEVSQLQIDRPELLDCAELAPGSYVLLKVTDNGTGMDAETRQRAFEPFFTTKEEGKGTGLGLSIVYGIVRQSGGAIALDTAPGQGSAFRIYLPELPQASRAAEAGASSSSGLQGSEAILLVENHEQVRAVTADILRSCGYRVIEAATASEAMLGAARSSEPIHLLLTDIQMPQGTGMELAERLRPMQPGMRVLYMSGTEGQLVSPRIAKPFNQATLTAKVREVLMAEQAPAS